jgi:hypothetical protein
MKRKRKIKGPFVAVPKAIMATRAWRAMTPGARLLWIELRGWLRNDDLNNGKVYLSCRTAAKAIGVNKETISFYYAENEHFGFLRKTAEGFLGSDGYGIAAKYRFTDLAHGTHAATRDYEKRDGSPFVYLPRRPGRKKQKPVRKIRTPCTVEPDIRKAGNGGSLCTAEPDIGEPPRCPAVPDISRLPSLTAAVGQDQGSSTARAPAVAHAAGGAGSSPAPDAKPDLTTVVLEIVDAQLDELERRRSEGHGGMNYGLTGNGGERGLSRRRVQEHADWYSDQAYWHYSKNALDAGALDAELRAILRKEVFPEHIEIEFERVMKVVSHCG